MTTRVVTHAEDQTQSVARALAETLRAGDVLLLSGPLGAGKTAFVRGLAAGLLIDPSEVSSPTFTLVHEYAGPRLRVYHADLYRLARTGLADLGLDEMGLEDGVLVIEWPERLDHQVEGAVSVTLEPFDETGRVITVDDPRSAASAFDAGHSIR